MPGLKASRHLSGGQTFRTKVYPVVTSGAVYPGDPVRVSSGVVKPVGTAVSAKWLGVVAYFLDENRKPYTHSLPSNAPYKQAGVTGQYAAVYDDPDIVYEVSADISASAGLIGAAHNVSAGTPVTALAQSGYVLTAAASAGDGALRVIGVAPTGDLSQTGSGTKAEVVIARHTFKDAF